MTRVVLVVIALATVVWLASAIPAGVTLAPGRHVPEKKSAREVDHLNRAGYLALQLRELQLTGNGSQHPLG